MIGPTIIWKNREYRLLLYSAPLCTRVCVLFSYYPCLLHTHNITLLYYICSAGARILTVFLYLNDVQEGGGTHFNDLEMTVMPKRGRAVLWPSVLDEAPMAIDERTFHEAMEVTAGNKYGANVWFHSRAIKGYMSDCVEDDDEEEDEDDEEHDAGETEEQEL
jgi:hypothetical protein